jgi:hypothetical protein
VGKNRCDTQKTACHHAAQLRRVSMEGTGLEIDYLKPERNCYTILSNMSHGI